jgi:RHS repeat-associated protein
VDLAIMTPMLAAQRLAQRLAERLAQRLAESDAITQSIRHFYRNGSATHRTVPELVSSETRNGLIGYNNLNQRTSRLDEGTAFTAAAFDAYGYNAAGELTASNRYAGADTGNTGSPITARDRAYEYDGIGNRTSFTQAGGTPLTYTSNKLNQYTATSDSNDSFSYDDDGNMTLVYQPSAGKLMNYFYDGENRLTEVRPVLPATGDKKVECSYDYRSRRVIKKVSTFNGSSWDTDSDERFMYDDWNVVAVYDALASYDLLKTYTWGIDLSVSIRKAGGIGGLLGCEERAGPHAGDYVFAYDGNGNVGQVIHAAGSLAAAYEYDAFGRVASSSGSYKDANVYRFSTKHVDPESDLYYYGYRFYSAGLGRWTNRDPIGEQGGANLYTFCLGNPVDWIDPTGQLVFLAVAIPVGLTATEWVIVGGCGVLMIIWVANPPPPPTLPTLPGFGDTTPINVPELPGFNPVGPLPPPTLPQPVVPIPLPELPGRTTETLPLPVLPGSIPVRPPFDPNAVMNSDARKTAEERAVEIQNTLKPGTQSRTTTAVTETKEGVRVISSSELRLRPSQREALKPGEVEGTGPGHAEVTGINAAESMGLTPTGTAASRPICPSCVETLQQRGVKPLSPLKKK